MPRARDCRHSGSYLGSHTEFARLLLSLLNTVISLLLFTLLFAAIFKVLPDTEIAWRDVAVGAMITALLFTVGKSLIGWYLGTTAASSGYGAAGALILILLWIYYSAQIFLFGAEIARAIAGPCRTKRTARGLRLRTQGVPEPRLQTDSTSSNRRPSRQMRRDLSPTLCGGMTEGELVRSKAAEAGRAPALRAGFCSLRNGTLEGALCCFDVEHRASESAAGNG